MGHFSYTCHLSGLPITGGTKCVLLPLISKDRVYDASTESLKRFGVGSLISNDGPNLYFNELTFPIFGTYDEYGGLEKIEKDDNTIVLEKFFNMKISKIVECILDGRKDQFKVDEEDAKEDEFGLSASKALLKFKKYPNQMLLVRASATWYRRDVYDEVVKQYRLSPHKDYFDKLDLGVPGLLKALGFKKGKEEKKGRYNIPFTKNDLTVWSDGNWLSDKRGESNNFGIYDLNGFKKWCEKKNVKINIDKFKNATHYEMVYDTIVPSIKKFERHDRWSSERVLRMLLGDESLADYDPNKLENYQKELENIKKLKEENPEEYEKRYSNLKFNVIEFYESMVNDAKKELEKNTLPLVYFEHIKNSEEKEFLRKNIVDWFIFKSFYYPTGRFLYPIGTSAQDGDHEKVLLLLQAATNILSKEVAERRKEMEEDELELENED